MPVMRIVLERLVRKGAHGLLPSLWRGVDRGMSRYNSPWYDLLKPFYDVFFLVVIAPVFILVYLLLTLIYGGEKAEEVIDNWLNDGLTNSTEREKE